MIPADISKGFMNLAQEAAKHGIVIKSVTFDAHRIRAAGGPSVTVFEAARYDATFEPGLVQQPVARPAKDAGGSP